jgi:glycosyltransferase involved in cell wall biosynthesis
MLDVYMFVLNNVKYDARVKKEALALSQKYKVTIIGIKQEASDTTNFSIQNIKVHLLSLYFKKILPKNVIGWFFKYIELIIRVNLYLLFKSVNIIHAHNLDALFPISALAKIKRCCLVYDSHELFTEMSGKRDNLINKLWFRIEKYLLNKVDVVIAANRSRAEIMHKEYGAVKMPEVILNVPTKQQDKAQDNKLFEYLKENNISNDNKIIIYQGGISKARNIDVLIKSIKFWQPGSLLFLIGPILNTEKSELEQLINREARVIYHPPVNSDILPHYTKFADIGIIIYANDSRNNYYCAPNKLYEYIFSSIPVCGSNLPEIKKVIYKYKVGEIFEDSNPESIATAINKILSNFENYNKKEIFTKITEEVNWEKQADKLLSIYKRIIG